MNTLLIIGTVDRSKPLAAVASLASSSTVLYTGSGLSDVERLTVEGRGYSGEASVRAVDPDDATDADAYVIVGTAPQIEAALDTRPDRFDGKPVLLSPGGFAGSLVAAERLRRSGVHNPRVGEVPGWMLGGKDEDGHIIISMRKRRMPFAAASDDETAALLEVFGAFFPDLVASDLIATSVGNFNAIIHPPSIIYNVTRIESGEDWHLWDNGFTPAVAALMGAVDEERLAVLEALGSRRVTLLDLALGSYADSGMHGETFYEAVQSFDMYRNHLGPAELRGRFLTDDVPHGVAAFEQLAAALALPHETLTAVRVLAELLVGGELKADQAAVDALIDYASRRAGESRSE